MAAVGTNTITYRDSAVIKKIIMDWTSDASGDVSGTATAFREGEILRVDFIPDSGGTQPTDQYDVTLTDPDSIDVLAGVGANQGNAASESLFPALTNGTAGNSGPVFFVGALSLVVANAGNAKGGKVIVYYR